MENTESSRYFPYSTRTDEGNGLEISGECDGLLNQLIPSETGPQRRGRRFTKKIAMKV